MSDTPEIRLEQYGKIVNSEPALEHREAVQGVSRGLSAPLGAHERYRQSLLPYIEEVARGIDAQVADGTALPNMRVAMMDTLVTQGYPLGIVLLGFKATEEEAEWIKDRPPLQEEPVDEIARLQALSYPAYLRSEHWQKTRSDALERAEHRCQLCGSEANLQVHHRDTRSYKRRGCERPADVSVVCDTCHARHHGKKPKAA